IWLPQVLKDAGLKVACVDGWENRGRAEMGVVKGVLCHHTAGATCGNMPTLGLLVNGRPDLKGPLAQLGLGRDGTFYVIAAGRSNHAGPGVWQGIETGNSSFIGIEAENCGTEADPWPAVQMNAYQRGVAAILNKLGHHDARYCVGHKEYALPKGRKSDPDFDMDAFRQGVLGFMNSDESPSLIPAVEPVPSATGQLARATIRRGSSGELVKLLQQKLGLAPDGNFGPGTEAALREFQRKEGIVPDGILGPKTWAVLDKQT
ncbi:MAG: hypothetical protein RLZZ271_1615, partial [Pseudomonadota bacterium]